MGGEEKSPTGLGREGNKEKKEKKEREMREKNWLFFL